METRQIPLKAYEDMAFLKGEHCRPVRLQLEYLKPEIAMHDKNIRSTIVLFGSARLPTPESAREGLERVRAEHDRAPDDPEVRERLRLAHIRMEQSHYYEMAREFASIVSRCAQRDDTCDFVIMTGGGGGIMEAGNRGANDVGAKSIGLNITLPFEQEPNAYITDDLCFQFHYFSIRKMHFLLRARALCAFPGGFGTMDEVFETLTLIQTGKIEPIPVVLFGGEFWRDVINWELFVERGLVSPDDLDIVRFCDTPVEAWDYIRNYWSYNQNGTTAENRSDPSD
ncbi:MAG: LOG family protein [Candidatus Pacebacteria bacterium]|nr:LOG family protein [Candidatus Paceibacterota bacterium]